MKAIDLFAGAGGFSKGAAQAGCSVVWAANHWQAAVDILSANHPGTAHACQDLQQADWREVHSCEAIRSRHGRYGFDGPGLQASKSANKSSATARPNRFLMPSQNQSRASIANSQRNEEPNEQHIQ